jgi:hypothetical protein
VQTVAEDEITAVVDEAHRHNVKVAIHSRGSTSTRAAAKAGVDLIYHTDLASEGDLDIVAKAGIPIAPVLTAPWIGVEHGAAARGFGDQVRDRLRQQLDASFQRIRNARLRGIAILSGSDTGNASAFAHGRWHGKEAELFVNEVGMTPIEAIAANTSRNAWLIGLDTEIGVIGPGRLADIDSGNVEYQSDFRILKPLDLDRGNGCLVRSGWQGDLPPGADRLTARFPTIPGITGMVREEFIAEATGLLGDSNIEELTEERFVGTLVYPIADPPGARLTVREREADPRVTPPGLAWRLVDDRHVEITRPTAPGFDRGAIFEFIYRARDPIVMGIGFAAIRDIISFLRHDGGQSAGAAGAAAHPPRAGLRHLAERPCSPRLCASRVQPGSNGTPGVRWHPSRRGGIAPHLRQLAVCAGRALFAPARRPLVRR